MYSRNRQARTIIEILVVFGILAVLFALTIPAIVKVRHSAAMTEEMNRVKQLLHAVHIYESSHDGRLPSVSAGPTSIAPMVPIMLEIVEQIDPALALSDEFSHSGYQRRIYQSALDTSYSERIGSANCNYIFNAMVFDDQGRISQIRDGISHTIAISENLANCGHTASIKSDSYYGLKLLPKNHPPYMALSFRRPSFADREYGDVYPATDQNGNLTIIGLTIVYPGRTNNTFEIKPKTNDCSPFAPNSNGSTSLIVGYFDGSVRQFTASTTKSIFWSHVSPQGGEVISD